MDRYGTQKKQAGVEKLNPYSNYYEIQTLCELLNTDYESVLKADDTFCTKILLSNVENRKFESNFNEIMSKQRKK